MRLQGGLIVLAVMAATLTSAAAACHTIPTHFHISQNEAVSTVGISTKGSACSHSFWTNGISYYSHGAIAIHPGHGALAQTGAFKFRYKPQRGFKGADRYSMRVCGVDRSGPGCVTVTYDISVE